MGDEGEDLGDEALLYAGVLHWVLLMRFLGAMLQVVVIYELCVEFGETWLA